MSASRRPRHRETPRYGLLPAQRDAVRIGGSLRLIDNPHTIFVRYTTIDGDLVCTGNTGPRGINVADTTVAGSRTDKCP